MAEALNCDLLLYADDSALMVSGKDLTKIESELSIQLNTLHDWLVDNRLSLHLGKTESILFGSKRKIKNIDRFHISCNGSDIESKQSVTYLGVTLDQSLSGVGIADKVVSKCSNKIKFLYRNARNFDLKTKKLLVSALVQCHFDYACTSWYSGLTQKRKLRLQTAQNKVIRYILCAPPRTHIGAIEFSALGMLPVDQRVDQLKLNHMFNIFQGVAPSYLSDMFQLNEAIYNTRSSTSTYVLPHVKSFGIHSFTYTGARLWNDLSLSTRHSQSKLKFKTLVKNELMSTLLSKHHNDFIYF